jgi:hypothetical protein
VTATAAVSCETIGTKVSDGIVTLTTNRPQKLNAFSTSTPQHLSATTADDLIAAFDAADPLPRHLRSPAKSPADAAEGVMSLLERRPAPFG